MNEDSIGFLRFCPDCSKPTINSSEVAGTASCYSCTWSGAIAETTHRPVDPMEMEQLSGAARADFMKNVVAVIAPSVTKWLIRWGFVVISERLNADLLRYVKAGSMALYESLLRTREEIAKEATNG